MSHRTLVRYAPLRIVMAGVLALSLIGGPPALAQDEAAAPDISRTGGDLIGYSSIHHPVIGRDGMVVTQSRTAARIGADILARGGNAVDAAVAVGLAATMTLSRAGNIGGGGYMLIHEAASKTTIAIEYYGQAPFGVTPDFLLGTDHKVSEAKVMSFKGVTVPGTVAGLYESHRRFGRLPWARLVQPAIDLASKGVVMTDDEATALAQRRTKMAQDPAGAAKIYLRRDGSAYEPGDVMRNPDLAWTLKQIQVRGADGFYKGPVADRLVAGIRAGGGIITLEDLAAYRANVLEPVWSDYRGHRIAYMPPTSAASSVAEAMDILEQFPVADMGQGYVATMHLLAETLKIVSIDRRYSGGGPQWATPARGIASKVFAAERAKLISMYKSLDSKSLPGLDPSPYESPDTTHYSIADRDGNVVANTYTLTASFGAHVVAP